MKFTRKYLPPYHCRICGIELNTTNWKSYNQITCNYICAICYNKSRSEYRLTRLEKAKVTAKLYYDFHQEQIKKYRDDHREDNKNYSRLHYINNGGKKKIKCIKRPHTLICELCNKETKITVYHHWDNEHPERGIWVCYWCHQLCECVEHELNESHMDKYLNLKEKIIYEQN